MSIAWEKIKADLLTGLLCEPGTEKLLHQKGVGAAMAIEAVIVQVLPNRVLLLILLVLLGIAAELPCPPSNQANADYHKRAFAEKPRA